MVAFSVQFVLVVLFLFSCFLLFLFWGAEV